MTYLVEDCTKCGRPYKVGFGPVWDLVRMVVRCPDCKTSVTITQQSPVQLTLYRPPVAYTVIDDPIESGA